MSIRARYATRAELINLLAEDDDERAVLEVVFQRLANHGVDMDALVKVSVDLVGEQLEEDPASLTPIRNQASRG